MIIRNSGSDPDFPLDAHQRRVGIARGAKAELQREAEHRPVRAAYQPVERPESLSARMRHELPDVGEPHGRGIRGLARRCAQRLEQLAQLVEGRAGGCLDAEERCERRQKAASERGDMKEATAAGEMRETYRDLKVRLFKAMKDPTDTDDLREVLQQVRRELSQLQDGADPPGSPQP